MKERRSFQQLAALYPADYLRRLFVQNPLCQVADDLLGFTHIHLLLFDSLLRANPAPSNAAPVSKASVAAAS